MLQTPALLQDSQKGLNSEGEDETSESEGEGTEGEGSEEAKEGAGDGKTSSSLGRQRDESPNSRRVSDDVFTQTRCKCSLGRRLCCER